MSDKNIETIAALATPPGKGGVGVIRISGPRVTEIANAILGGLPKPRFAAYAQFKSNDGEVIDNGLALFFPKPNSFTGEDVLELQGHGGPIIIDILLKRITTLGARLARPGEFSERAFLNGKLDLAQAEAIADAIDAGSVQAARSAMQTLQGDFSKKINELLASLVRLRTMIEATIDFPDEEVDFLPESTVIQDLEQLLGQLESIQQSAKQGVLLREGLRVVIAGKPNAGKSSLLNCLSGRDAAIVTDVAGTTRDTLQEYIQIDGLPLHVIDTAGIQQTENVVEQEGLRRAHDAIEQADLILLVVDGTTIKGDAFYEGIPEAFQRLFKARPLAIIKNKIDLLQVAPSLEVSDKQTVIGLSVKEENGIDLLRCYLKEFAGFQDGGGTFIARRRHLDALRRAQLAIQTGLVQFKTHEAGELLAEELTQAQRALSEITGKFTTDDLLGEIFSSFCIGK